MLHEAQPSPKTRASLRIFSPGLNPDDVEATLGVMADHKHLAGDFIGQSKEHKYKAGMWLRYSKSPPEAPLEAHLDELLSSVEQKRAYIESLQGLATVDISCVLFWQSGFQLSPQILARISAIGATFGTVVYPMDSEEATGLETSGTL